MKTYPSITKEINSSINVYAFAKFDGQNFRATWNPKKGFFKFGSRTQLVDESNKQFNKAINILHSKFSSDLEKVFTKNKYRDVTCFFEYWGPNSFAGQHVETEEQTLTLIDVNPFNVGIMPPLDFIRDYGHLDIPDVLYIGKADGNFVSSVKDSSLKGMPLEGVICKGSIDRKTKVPVMFKIKSNAWLDKLKIFCNNDEALYEKLM